MDWTVPLLFAWVLVGHLAIWVALFNRMHATAIPRGAKKSSEKVIMLITAIGIGLLAYRYAGPGEVGWVWFQQGWAATRWGGDSWRSTVDVYAALCLVVATIVFVRWAVWQWTLRRPDRFRLDAARRWLPDASGSSLSAAAVSEGRGRWCGEPFTGWMAGLPFNQLLDVEVNDKSWVLPQRAAGLDGLTLAHVSDLHLTGQLSRAFYEDVFGEVARLDCDLVAITGDIIDRAPCLDWLGVIFRELAPPLGAFYVLGNHDRRIKDESDLRRRLADAGLIAAGGVWHHRDWGGGRIWLTGNELPWYGGAERLGEPESTAEGPDPGDASIRVLLSHSPDQIGWAARRGFDLMLAGHTHGGQIRPPGIGPIVSPSVFGPKYASGEFVVGPTSMHVSRGVCGTHPIRINCRPEITRLTLRAR